jgi:hypothetical protein
MEVLMELFILFLFLVSVFSLYRYTEKYQISDLGWWGGVLGIFSLSILSMALVDLVGSL